MCLAQLFVGLLVTYRVSRDPDLTRRIARERRGGVDSDEDDDRAGLLGAGGEGDVKVGDLSLSVST